MSVSTRYATPPAPLPVALTPLLGRERETTELLALLGDPAIRLVTITGPGGVGKTRLALHLASTIASDTEERVAYVSLASITDPALVLPEIVQSFGVFTDAHDAPEDQLATILGDAPTVLVLDNLEQVLGAAAAIARVLSRCPRVTALATSQAPLSIYGEQLYPLAPLPTPTATETMPAEILRSEAVMLFIQRARAIVPNLVVDDRTAPTIAEICRQLDGLPLAIELAAARTNILSPEALLARLSNRLQVLGSQRRDVPDRLRTMRNAVAWSYDLLPPDEQMLFRRLAIFAGGFPLEAAEAMFASIDPERDAFDALSTLVNHSLMQQDPAPRQQARFLMLESLRAYGLEQLRAHGEEAGTRLAHASWFAELAEHAEPALTGPAQAAWMETLDAESENMRAAVAWALAGGQVEIALRIVSAIWRYAPERGLIADYRGWMARGLDALDPTPGELRVKALLGAGYLAEDQWDLAAAESFFADALDDARALGDRLAESRALIGLGTVAHDQGDYASALSHHDGALDAARGAGDQRATAIALGNLATVSYFQGNLDASERYWNESLQIIVSLGEALLEASTGSNLAALASERGDFARAQRLLTRTLEIQRRMNAQRGLPLTLINLGEAARGLGDYALAHDYLDEAVQLLREAGNTVVEGHALNACAALAFDQGDITSAADLVLDSTRLVATGNDQLSIVENAELMGRICSASGRHGTAVELVAAAGALRELLDASPNPVRRRELDAVEERARKALSPSALAGQRTTGSSLSDEALSRRIGIVAREITGPRRAAVQLPVAERADAGPPPAGHALTGRELEVLRLLVEGKSTQEISDALFISPRTTTTHVANILGKLDVSSRTAAVAHALREGIV
jgi:predicted ATPase/DNA-binding CsgD family transcriptional regulator